MCGVFSTERNHSLTEICGFHRRETGGKGSGKLHDYKNQMAQCLYFALADDRREAIVFSMLCFSPPMRLLLLACPAEIQGLMESAVVVAMSSSCCEMKQFPEIKGREKEVFVSTCNLCLFIALFTRAKDL